jgi:hypothetical protein
MPLSVKADDEVMNDLRRAASDSTAILDHFKGLRDAAERLQDPGSRIPGLKIVRDEASLLTISFLGRRVVFTAHYDGASRGGKLLVALQGREGKTLTSIETIPFEAGNGNTAITIPGAPEGMNLSLADAGDCYSLVARCIESALHHDPP